MEKITIQHFINKDLNPSVHKGVKKYPVYVQVIVLRKNLRFKSNNTLFSYLSENELDIELVKNILQDEKDVIERIVRDLIRQEKRELITSKNISLYSQYLSDAIDDNFSKFLEKEQENTGCIVPNILLSATYQDFQDVVFFYSSDMPFRQISKNMDYCIEAINIIFNEALFGTYNVYDLFYGEKKERIELEMNMSNSSNHEETNKMMLVLQDLTML